MDYRQAMYPLDNNDIFDTLTMPDDGLTLPAPNGDGNGGLENGFGAGQMIENLHNLTERDEVPMRKRKVQDVEGGRDDENKKSKTAAFGDGGSGGVISDHLKDMKKQGAAAQPIDLTNDDDDQPPAATEEEVQIVKETTNSNEVVCLGVLHGNANVHRIPAVSQSLMRSLPKGNWPKTRLEYVRGPVNNNMIELVDRAGAKFGMLEVRLAQGLCPLLQGAGVNKSEIRVYLQARPKADGEYVGQRVSKLLKVDVILKAPRNLADRVGKYLSQKQLFLSAPMTNPGVEVFNPHDQSRPVYGAPRAGPQAQSSMGTIGRTVEQILRETSSMFDSLAKDEELPEKEADSSIISSPLMEHQKKALSFLVEHERGDYDGNELPPHSLWKFRSQANGRGSFYNLITDEVVLEKPEYIRGGILADVMGLGKTLSILALIAETWEASRAFKRQGVPDLDGVEQNSKATLIVCPKSVLANWQEQIRLHTAKDKLKIITYHGSSRVQDLHQLSKYDIILTSYNIAGTELSSAARKKSPLRSLNFFRIVLDEAHSIRNVHTKIAQGCCALNAERRWAITGTPIQNTLHDLGALFKFLHLKPFNDSMVWAQYIINPFKNGDVKVIEMLQMLVRSVTLRRTKSTINLPDRTVQRVRLDFNKYEANLYRSFATRVRSQFNNITQGGQVALKGKAYAHVLKSLSRLRLISAHGKELLSEEDMEDIQGEDQNNAIVLDIGDEPGLESGDDFVKEKTIYDTFKTYVDSDADICVSCTKKVGRKQQPVDDTVDAASESGDEAPNESTEDDGEDDANDLLGHITPCFHLVCTECTERYKSESNTSMTSDGYHLCQFCEGHVRFGMFPIYQSAFLRFTEERKDSGRVKSAKWDENTYSGPSTKVKELLKELHQSAAETAQLPEGEPPIRSVVFSGWTQYLDLIEYALENEGIGCTRIDGSMSVKQRSQALHVFNNVDHVVVLLVSIKAGGQGLNFTSANKAYVMEPQYNPGVEHQAVDRVHRIGQKRDVTIKHFIMNNSVEEKILELQTKKEALANLSLERKRGKGEDAKQRMEELRALFK